MENNFENKIVIRGINNRMANMANSYTCTISVVDLLFSLVLLTRGEFLKFPGHVISITRVQVPARIIGM
jgi:hypothetical protein